MKNILDIIGQSNTPIIDWVVYHAVMSIIKWIIGIITTNQAYGVKPLILGLIIDLVCVYVLFYGYNVDAGVQTIMYEMVEEQGHSEVGQTLQRNLVKVQFKDHQKIKIILSGTCIQFCMFHFLKNATGGLLCLYTLAMISKKNIL